MTVSNAALLMAGHYYRSVLRTRRSVIVLLLFVAVLLVFGASRVAGVASSPRDAFRLYLMFLYTGPIGFLVQFAGLFYGAAIITEEQDNGTAHYLFVRPLPRLGIFIGRYLAALLFGAVTLTALNLTVYLILVGPSGGLAPFLASEVPVLLGAACYLSVFTILAALVRNPVVIGVLIIFFWEQMLSMAPFKVNLATVKYHLLCMVKGWVIAGDPSLTTEVFEVCELSAGTSLIIVALVALATLAGAYHLFRRKEFVGR